MREVLKDVNTPSAKQQSSSRAKPAPVATPVTAHRLFPAIVALWFAALLGIGSLVIAPEALSAVVSALGIPKLIHAASPPLGFTARALLALVMAGSGVVIGLIIGSRIAARHKAQPLRKIDPTKGRQVKPTRTYSYKPAEQALEAETGTAQKRGPLRASEAFADIEPLTDRPEPALQADYEDVASPSDDHFAVLGAPRVESYQPDDAIVHDHFDALLANPMQHNAIAELVPPASFTTPVDQHEAPGFEPALEGRLTRDPIKLQAAQPHPESPRHQPECELAPEPEPETEPHPAPSPVAQDAVKQISSDTDARRPLSEAPLETLGTVQLVERLALAMAAAEEARTEGRNAPSHFAAPIAQPTAAASEAATANASPSDEPMELEAYFEDAPHQEVALRFVAPMANMKPEPAFQASEPWSGPDFAKHASLDATALDAPAPRFQASPPSILDPIAQAWGEESNEDDDAPTIAPPRFLSTNPGVSGELKPASLRDNRPLFGGRQSPPARAIDENTLDELDEGSSDNAGEDRYPSLLDIQSVPREAIRIAAPEAHQAEPIVMFPNVGPPNAGPNAGQRADAPFAPPPASTLQSRRGLPFQAPAGAGAGAPIMPPELPADPVDAEEADRALRAALATLQRMSGGR